MLTPLELDIMKAVWNGSPTTVRNVQIAIRPSRSLAYTTVLTIMDRLHHKGFLKRTMRARTHYYEPAIEYASVRDEAVGTLIKSYFGSKEKLREFLNGEPPPAPSPRPNGDAASHAGLDETLL
jgi:predicted transcriptional regulator